ncbi:MAG: chitobiase/beta-hexosaminidase C-terminal domain-containing protein [Bacteroidaceae bacterium]|nr:chitobiase/beta-hexosaminidase C-terminal domain-containing protein [Bacteroidaceae bacterium]
MEKITKNLRWLLASLMLVVGMSSAWAQDPYYTLDTTTDAAKTTNNSYAGTGTATIDGIEWAVNGNGQMYPWRLGGKSISNTDRTVNTNTAMGSAINKVVLTVGTASSITVNSLKLTVASDASFSTVLDEVTATFAASSDITFEPSTGTEWATGAYYKFTFNVTVSQSSNKFVQFSGVKFYAPSASNAVATPTISPNGGTFATSQEVAITCTTSGATIQYSIDGGNNWQNYSSPFTITETTTVQAKATKSGMTDSGTATATFTKAKVYTSLQQLQEDVTSTSQNLTLQMTDIYVTAVKNNNAYISDGTYGALIYTSGHGLTAGQKLNGTLSNAQFVLYRGQTEITNFSSTGLTITEEALPAQVKTIDQITAANQSLLVTLENVTYDGTVLSDGTNSITPYTTFMNDLGLESGKTYNITGIVVVYNSTLEFAPRTADDIVEVGGQVDTRTETHITFTQGSDDYPSGSEFTITVGDDFTSPEAWVTFPSGVYMTKTAAGPYLSYSGDNDEVATVNSETGALTFVAGATGTITVTATFTGTTEYKPCEGYYILKVKPEEVTPTGTGDEITHDFVGVTGTTYTSWSGKEGTSGAVYAGNTAGGNNAVQMRSTNSSGIITTTSGGKVTMVTVEWNDNTSNSRTLDIYGSNEPYDSAADLYNSDSQGTKLGSITKGSGESTQLVITGDYAYIGIRSNSGALWCDKITIYWENSSSSAVATTTTIDATGLTNTDVNAGTNAGTLTATVMAGSTAVSGATVTWESSNTAVATVDADGVVTLVAAGSTTITATYAGVTDQYQSSSDTYELTVTNSSATPGDELFNETFAGFNGTGGRDGVYSGSVGAGSTASTDEEGWTFDKCGGASSSLKFGTGSANGVFTTRSIALNGDGTLTFSAAGWGSGTNTLAVTAEGGDVSGNTDITLENSDWKDYTVNITGATGNLVLTFTGKRGFIDDIKVVSAAPDERTATTVTLTPATESYNVILGEDFTAPTAALDPAAAGTLTYESSDEDVAEVAANGAVTIKAAGTTTITAKFEGTTEYKPSQASYTINVTAPAVAITSLQELQEATTSISQDVTLQLSDIYVTAVKGTNNAYISDGTYGALIYTNNHGLEAGKKFSGTLNVKSVLYKGATEITNFDATSLTFADEALVAQTKTIGEITVANQSLPVKFEGVTYDAENTQFTDGTNTIKYYNNFGISPAPTLEDGHIYDITGIIVMYNNLQIAPLAATDVVDVTPAATVEAPVFDPVGGTYDSDQTVTITCATAGSTIFYTLDGTDPATNGTEYTTPVVITATTTLKAIAVAGADQSTITTAEYIINKNETPFAWNYGTEYYTKVTDLSQITNGDAVIIVNETGRDGESKALNTEQANNRKSSTFEWIPWIGGSFAQLDAATTDIEKFILVKEGNYFYFYASRGTTDGYIYMAGANSNNYLKTQTNQDANAKAAITFDESGNATIVFQGSGSRNTLMYNSSADLFSCYGSGQQPVQIYVEGSTADVEALKSVTTKAVQDNYMTFVTPYDAMFDGTTEHAYIVTLNADNTEATLTEVFGVPAGTPVIYKNDADSETRAITRAISGSTVMDDVSANVLKVSRGEIVGDESTIYVLNKKNGTLGFYQLLSGNTLASGKCYLKIEASGAKFIGLDFDGEATGIAGIEEGIDTKNGVVYNLAGQRVATPVHGLYIVNGKKVFIK